MNKDNKPNLTFYLYLQGKLLEHSNNIGMISVVEAKKFLSWYKIPNNLKMPILKEMESLELILIHSRYKVEIINKKKNKLLDNTSKLYKVNGLW